MGRGLQRDHPLRKSWTKMQGYIQLVKSPEGAGRANCFSLWVFFFFLFLQKCEDKRGAAGNTGAGMERRAGRQACVAGSRGRGGRGGAAVEGVVAVSSHSEKQSRINPKDCHSFVSELYSFSEGHISTFFTSGKDEM